jgi:hypothetical protein
VPAVLVFAAVTAVPMNGGRAYAADCIGSGTEAPINAALQGSGAAAVLCPGAVFTLDGPVRFTAQNQQLYTLGRPVDGRRAVLRVSNVEQTTAVDGNNQSGVVLSHVQVDGGRPALGRRTGSALIQMGGSGSNQTVRDIRAYDTRSWSLLHFFEGAVTNDVPQCQNATVLDSTFGPAGDPNEFWADGISMACGNSLVQGNLVQDATDGAIVLFGAPGTTVRDNTIVAQTRQLLGGINLVDYKPLNGNYTGTTVTGNVIDGRGAFIKVAIAMGPAVWNCDGAVNYGATVTANTVQGQHVGYGYAVSGVRDWTVTGNLDRARHVGAVVPGCAGVPSLPGAFQRQKATTSVLQGEFRDANVTGALSVTEPDILRVARPPTGCMTLNPDDGLSPHQQISSCDGRFRLILQLDGNLVLYRGHTPLWATGTTQRSSAVAIMQQDGNFVVYDSTGAPLWSTVTGGRPGSVLRVQDDGNLVLYSRDGAALWSSNTGGH